MDEKKQMKNDQVFVNILLLILTRHVQGILYTRASRGLQEKL